METNQDTRINNDTNDTAMSTPKQQSGLGPIIGILIIVTLISFGGVYFWGSHILKRSTTDDGTQPSFEVIDTTIEDAGTMTEEEFNALLQEQGVPTDASDQTDPTLDAAVDNLDDLDSLDTELNDLGSQL